MDCWSFLKIEPTKDKKEIKRAYSKLLPVYHPERDHDGFMKLRQAYEEAVNWAEAEQKPEEEKTPVDLWMDRVETVYNNFKDRVNVEKWQELLDEDVCVAIDSAQECNERLLIFLADHILVPHEVLHVLEHYFKWESNREQLCEQFPFNYIDYLCANAKYPDNFRYLLLDTDMDIDYDAFLEEYYKLEREIQQGESEEVAESILKIQEYGVLHPDLLEILMRGYLLLEEFDKVRQMCRQLEELEPEEIHTFQCLARCHLEMQEYEEALQYYEKILERKNDNVGAMLGKAACFKEQDRYEEALEIARKAQEILPYDGYVRNFLVMLNEEMVDLKKKQYEANPSDNRCCYEYCLVLAEAYHFEEAVKILPKVSQEGIEEKEYLELCSRVYMDMENQNCVKAIPCLERLVELEPDKQNYYEDLGYCYGEAKRYEDAKAVYAKAKALNSESPRVYYRLAQIYIKEKRYEDAVKVCDEGLACNDQIPNLYHFKAEAYYYMREYGRAMELCDRAISILPYVDTFEIKAKIFNDCEEYEEVENLLKDMQESEFMSDMLYAQLARAKRRLGKVEEAKQILDRLIGENSKEAEIYYQRGILYFSEETGENPTVRYEKAICMAKKALERDREFVFEHLLLEGHSLLRLGHMEEAIALYEDYEKKGCMNEQMALTMGDLFMETEKAEKAAHYYEEALQRNPRGYSVHGRLCDAYMELERYEEALREVNLQLEIDPSDYYYIDRGIIYNALGERYLAEQNYRLALEENSENCYAWSNLGYTLRDEGRLPEALEAFENAVQNEHPNPANYYEAARLCRRLGKVRQGAEYLQALADKGEKRYSSMLLLAKLYGKLGELEKSVAIYEEMKQNCPEDGIHILTEWADLYKHRGQYDAMKMIWKKKGTFQEWRSFAYYKYMAGYYMDYCNSLKKALKYYEIADGLEKDSYVCSQLGVIYEKLGKQKKAQKAYQQAYQLDLQMLQEGNGEDPCAFDCVGMDYAWLGQYDEAVRNFYNALYYGPTCVHCSMGECYEVYYDIADALERKAQAILKGTLKKENEVQMEGWIAQKRLELENCHPEARKENRYVPPETVIEELLQLLREYEKAVSYEACLAMAYAYYTKALQRRPEKIKYHKAVERLKKLTEEK